MKTNPLNIRKSKDIFLGELKSTGEFKVFISCTYGVRAAIKIIHHYITAHNCTSIRSIVSRWAPPTENDTEKYIKFVCQHCNLKSDDKLFFSKATFLNIIHAMAIYESNINLTNKCLLDAYNLAFINT